MYDINGTVREVLSKLHSHRLICLPIPGGKETSQSRALDCVSSDVLSSKSLLVLKDSPAYHQGGMGSIPNLSVCDLWNQSSTVTGSFKSTSVSSYLYRATNFVHIPSMFRWRIWLRHCATSRKVAGSVPDGVNGIFQWHNYSGRTMALGPTQPLTEMSTKNISLGGKGCRCVGLTTLPPSCADFLEMWEPQPTITLRSCRGL